MRGELPTAVRPFPTSLRTHSQRPQAMDNSPEPWYKTKANEEMERLEAVLNLRKSGSATGTTAKGGCSQTRETQI